MVLQLVVVLISIYDNVDTFIQKKTYHLLKFYEAQFNIVLEETNKPYQHLTTLISTPTATTSGISSIDANCPLPPLNTNNMSDSS